MLEVVALSFEYQSKPLLKQLQFSLAAGELLHLRGANGAGKTTLLKLIAGLLQPLTGEIYYNSELINRDLAAYQRQICYVGHKTGLSSLLTVRENCTFDSHWGRSGLIFEQMLADFGLEELADEPCYLLSAGQRRRVSLLRIAMTNASLWLLDEPLVALDTKALQSLMKCLKQHTARGGQVILTSHQPIPYHEAYREYCL